MDRVIYITSPPPPEEKLKNMFGEKIKKEEI